MLYLRSLSVTLLPLACIAIAPLCAQAQGMARQAEQMRYQSCIAGIGSDAEAALEEAQTWRIEGGGWPAEVCEAQAFIALGDHAVGAGILEGLANQPPAGMVPQEQADFLTLAAESRALAGDHEQAMADYDRAIDLVDDAVMALAGRARLNLDAGDWPALERDANRLIQSAPHDAEGWFLRAERRLNTGDLDGAQTDMEAARERAPERIDILVLRGRINEARRQANAPD